MLNKKKILLIRNAAYKDFGGAETYQVSIAKILQSQGHTPIIVTRSHKLLAYAKSNNIRTIKCWWWSRQDWSGRKNLLLPLYIIWQLILIMWYIKTIIIYKPDVLHIQSKDDWIAGTYAGRIMRKRIIWSDHMDLRYIYQNVRSPYKNFIGKLVRFSTKFAHSVIIISQNEMNIIASLLNYGKVLPPPYTLVNNGVIDVLDSLPKRKTDLENVFVFCIASRIVKNKGVQEAIESFQIVKRNYKGTKKLELAIYGNGDDFNYFKNSYKNVPGVNFYGHQKKPLEKIFHADVFMLPSYQEGFSIALLEATMLGKAIIVSDVDSNSEIISHLETGLLVRVRNTEDLAKSMMTILCDKSLKKKLEKNSRNNFINNYNLKSIVISSILPLYLSKN
jgi:glycosyltransferase involved in cell wall biosynthesis